jgi:hypothetical protein
MVLHGLMQLSHRCKLPVKELLVDRRTTPAPFCSAGPKCPAERRRVNQLLDEAVRF